MNEYAEVSYVTLITVRQPVGRACPKINITTSIRTAMKQAHNLQVAVDDELRRIYLTKPVGKKAHRLRVSIDVKLGLQLTHDGHLPLQRAAEQQPMRRHLCHSRHIRTGEPQTV